MQQEEQDRPFAAVDVPGELAYDRTGPNTPAGRYLRQFWIPVALDRRRQAGPSENDHDHE